MPKYNMIPCRLTWIWGVAGYFLGMLTSILGSRHLLIYMKAAEKTAHSHLASQSEFLFGKDDELDKTIAEGR
jgi:demethoxyubiquinone hydroxylase (CLK1/Coq7/Cat5 family)